jgi:hypothetical protein
LETLEDAGFVTDDRLGAERKRSGCRTSGHSI